MPNLYIRGGATLPTSVCLPRFLLTGFSQACFLVFTCILTEPFDIPVNLHSLGRRFAGDVGEVNVPFEVNKLGFVD